MMFELDQLPYAISARADWSNPSAYIDERVGSGKWRTTAFRVRDVDASPMNALRMFLRYWLADIGKPDASTEAILASARLIQEGGAR